jgi:hypothetical protein
MLFRYSVFFLLLNLGMYAQVQLDATGSGNAFVVTYPAVIVSAPSGGIEFTFKANHSITGAATLNLNGTGAKPILKNFNKPLVANDIITGQFVKVIYDPSSGGIWQMLSNEATPQGNISGSGSNGAIPFWTAGNTLSSDNANFFWDNTNKRLGIGTNAPISELSIFNPTNNFPQIVVGSPGTYLGVLFDKLTGAGKIQTILNQYPIQIGYDGSQFALHISNSANQGRVGIGTENPNQKLTVNGNISTSGTTFMQNARINALTNGVLSVNGTGNVVLAPALGDNLGNHTATTQIQGTNGSVGAPSYTFGSNPSTGVYLINTNIIGIATNGTNRILYDGFGHSVNPPSANGYTINVGGSAAFGIYGTIDASAADAPNNGLVVSGNVGIGTSVPGQKLVVVGNASTTGTSFMQNAQINALSNGVLSVNGTGQLVLAPSSASLSGSGANGAVNFWTGANTQSADAANFFWDNTNKRLGIGKGTPWAPIHLADAQANRKIILTSTNNDDHQFYGFGANAGVLRYQVDSPPSAHVFYTGTSSGGSTELMRIQGNGNVGIGKTNPDRRLDIGSDGTNWMSLVVGGQGGTDKVVIGNLTGFATIGAHDATLTAWRDLVMQRNGGNVGIGTTTVPLNKLDVFGAVAIGSYAATNTAPSNGMIVSGNVGIGITTPNAKLDLVGAFMIQNGFPNNTARPSVGTSRIAGEISAYGTILAGDDGFMRLSAGGGSTAAEKTYIDLSGYSLLGDMNKNIVFGVNGVERMRIVNGGNVGIGTNAPGALLHVRGTAPYIVVDAAATNQQSSIVFAETGATRWQLGKQTDNSFFIYDQINTRDALRISNTGNIILAPTAGNVGIGTLTPNLSTLQVERQGSWVEIGSFVYANGANNNATISTGRANGTQVTPTALLNNDILGYYYFKGHNGTAFAVGAEIRASATENFSATNSGTRIIFATKQNAGGAFNDRMVIDHNGNVGIGINIPGYGLHVQNGAVAGNGAYVNLSDKRLKKNIIPISNAIALIKLLQGVHFDWDTTKAKNLDFEGPHQPGFLAQEVMKIIPEAVSYDKINDRYSVAYSKVIPFLVEAMKEQQKLIENMQSENSNIKIQNLKLQEQSASIQSEIDAIKRHLGLDVKSEK